MSNTNKFEYSYSAKEQEEIKKIRQKYTPREEDKMQLLRKLDESVTVKGTLLSLIVGIISALILGFGMSCCLVWGNSLLALGIAAGIIGIIGVSLAYPLYSLVTARERERLAPQILLLADELMKK